MPLYSVKGFFEINEDMVQILLMLEVLLHRVLRLKICSVVLLLALNPACSSAIISSAWSLWSFGHSECNRVKSIQDDFQHEFARMTDDADSSVVLAEL